MAEISSSSPTAVNFTPQANETTSMAYHQVSSDYQYEYNMMSEEKAFENPFEIINLIICILGLVANGLSIASAVNIPHGLTTHSKLIISLCISDSLILVAVIAHFLTYINSVWIDCYNIVKRVIQDTAVLATLLNLLAMTGDHYFAIIKPLCYGRFMNSVRCNILILTLWILSLIVGLLEVIIGKMTEIDIPVSFCILISLDEFDSELIMTIIIFVVLFCMVVFYTIIYFVVKKIIRHDQMLYHDTQHNHKATITTMLIIGTFVLFWTPMACFKVYTSLWAETLVAAKHGELRFANDFLLLLLLLNSLADPLIYAIRLKEVQNGYKVMLLKLFPDRRFSINEEEYRNHLFGSRRRDTIPTMIHDNRSIPSPDSEKAFKVENKTEESSFISHKNNHCEHSI